MIEHLRSLAQRIFGEPFQIPATSINQLVLFTLALLGIYLANLTYRRARVRRSRQSIPFVIGGWGTRGKSGTERKKAALFQELGVNLLSKTTGCEAMVIHAQPGIDSIEIPIYRPGNKAGIWEQERVVSWASRLKTDLFLWECMAVSSDYASIMQNEWMRDDLSTLSNAFVDHENIQGPTGIDVARSLASFTPPDSRLFTAEESMLPIIEQQGNRCNTTIVPLEWHESDLISDDVLAMFPYRVHPRNLGLVLKLAGSLGIDRDFALRAISQNIVPDLGAFKCFSTEVGSRTIEFWNGMSANDRISCVSNWELAGFDRNTDSEFIVTVVNNRDDRIARSHEFSELIATRTTAHLHVLIGTNLEGLLGYIRESLDRYFEQISFSGMETEPWSMRRKRIRELICHYMVLHRIDGMTEAAICAKLLRMTQHKSDESMRVFLRRLRTTEARDAEALRQTICSEFGVSDEDALPIAWHLMRDLTDLHLIEDFWVFFDRDYPDGKAEPASMAPLELRFRALIQQLAMNRIEVIRDRYASGDQIIRMLLDRLPPHYTSRIMGLQNIKGTGLDFAYRWVSLSKVQAMLMELDTGNPDTQRAILGDLQSYDDFGIIDAPLAIRSLKAKQGRFDDDRKLLLEEAIRKIEQAYDASCERLKGRRRNRLWQWTLKQIEHLLDATDSKRRKRKVDRVMNDLFHRRISHTKAASVLHELGRRQDGGWLAAGTRGSHT